MLWDKQTRGSSTYFTKSLMSTGSSLEALQWLLYVQEFHEILTDKDGNRVPLQHQYFRGERKEGEYSIDGFAEVDGKKHFFEFLGCFWHPNCPDECKGSKANHWSDEQKNLVSYSLGYLKSCHFCHLSFNESIM